VHPELQRLFGDQRGVATFAQIVNAAGRSELQRHLRAGSMVKLWPGVYGVAPVDTSTKLRALDLRCGEPVPVCLHSAAALYGFDTEAVTDLHVLNPLRNHLRNSPGLVIHRREGVPLTTVRGRLTTPPAWTAVEVARSLRRPRALATLDQALQSGTCNPGNLLAAAGLQSGRRGIVMVRDLIPLARPGAESPMESEARLVMVDGGLPEPVLQYEVFDSDGRRWRLDFAWPEQRVAVEYDGFDFHSSPEHLRRDRQKRAALQELGWCVIHIVAEDVRRRRNAMVRRIDHQLQRTAA
jgi:Protein of unknown function (DUF559)